jgi:N-methylhydantoinase B
MGTIVERSARSPIFTDAHDFSCFLTDAQGCLIAQADGLPIHTGGAGETIKSIIRYFDDIGPGDIIIANDPYLAAGSHLPDVILTMPIFLEDSLCFFAGVRGHHIDIGGGHAGGFMPGATEIFQEGLRIPPLRIAQAGHRRRDVMNLVLANNREPVNVESDFEAMIGAITKASEFLEEIGKQLGFDLLQDYLKEILLYGERRMRAELKEIPDGEYNAEEKLQLSDGHFETLKVCIRVKGDNCEIDFTGTDNQILDPRNSPLSNTMSAVYAALNVVVDPNIPHNEGTYRPVEITAPEGSIVNPTAPYPVGTCTWAPGIEIIHLCWKAWGKAIPDRVCGAWGRILECNLSGYDSETHEHFVSYLHMVEPGQGAGKGSDGLNVISATNCLGSLILPNIEIFEIRYPFHFLQYEFRQDGGGAGKYQGGTGNIVELELLKPMTFAWAYEDPSFHSTFGIAGGQYAKSSEIHVTSTELIPDPFPITGNMNLQAGDIIKFLHSGGGGWGDSQDRPVEKISRDLRDKIISENYARKYYPQRFGTE